MLTLYRPCAYPGAVLRHASGMTGPRNSSRSFTPFINSSLPGSSKSWCSRKQTKPSLSKINNSTLKMKLFLSKGFLAHFRGQKLAIHVSAVQCQYEELSCRASVPTNPRNLESFSGHQIVDPGIVEITLFQKANKTQPLKNQQLYFENEAFLIKRFFSTLSWSKSSHPRIDRTLSVRRIVMSCFRPDESPKFGIVLRSSNRRSRDRRNHVVPESTPNPASPQLYFENEAFF